MGPTMGLSQVPKVSVAEDDTAAARQWCIEHVGREASLNNLSGLWYMTTKVVSANHGGQFSRVPSFYFAREADATWFSLQFGVYVCDYF